LQKFAEIFKSQGAPPTYQRNRCQIFPQADTGGKFATGVNYTSGKFATGVNEAGGKLSLVSTTPAANLPPV
jgi:hypothetical protein